MSGESGDQPSGEVSGRGSNLVGLLLLFSILVGLVFVVVGLAPADLPPDKSSNFIDSIFHNKGVILAARLLLVSAAVVLAMGGVFIIASMIIRMKNGEWLKRAGPFEIGESALTDIESQIERWRKAAKAGEEEVSELSGRIQVSDELITELQDEIEKLHLEIDDG